MQSGQALALKATMRRRKDMGFEHRVEHPRGRLRALPIWLRSPFDRPGRRAFALSSSPGA